MDYAIQMLNQLRPILQGFRKNAGLTQAAMAARLGVTQQTYAQLEANPAAVSVERLFRVLRILQVDLKLSQNETADQDSVAPAAGSNTGRGTRTPREQPDPAQLQARGATATKRSTATAARETSGARPAAPATKQPARAAKARAAAGVGKKREEW
ncbi:transcriptional regulator [Burkholderia sp. SRS-W-2-2016]|uniref:helix-turn-helix transcriptional regulator n=1 Tax=Burkholderia sp. SRS-W-2-2016 TaxID=1926878 RepID=UPI00094AAC69|nr:helix-turn-helix transcriptional regulator [Burkholderia sp. SRS-W-2-2016]OLL27703.1 transcriptional regulator [Burkholderia sp. SRS-W-2-2016]